MSFTGENGRIFSTMKKWGFFLTVWISFFCHIEIQAIPLPETLCYLHPRPDTEWALTTTPIILAFTSEINLSDVRFQVTGNESGPHQGSAIFSDDNRTIRFQPFDLFLTDEMVDVHISGAIDFSYRFRTRSQPVETFQEKVFKNHQESNFNSVDPIQSKTKRTAASINGVSVPSDFPTIRVQQYGETAPGKIFFASTFGTLGNYIVILKNDGTPYFYRRYPGYTNIYSASSGDFKLQPTGVLSAFIYRWNAYIVLDQNYNEVNYHRQRRWLE
jgi:hypothetical protein